MALTCLDELLASILAVLETWQRRLHRTYSHSCEGLQTRIATRKEAFTVLNSSNHKVRKFKCLTNEN